MRSTTLLNESHPVHSMEHSIIHNFRQNVPIDSLIACKARYKVLTSNTRKKNQDIRFYGK